MNNPTPIKRHQALVAFSKDHHFGLLLVWKIKQGLDNAVAPERISNYVLHFFEQDLKQHFEEEEKKLFPLLPVDNALRLRAENEHAIIQGLIEQLRNDQPDKTVLLQFAQRLNDHIRFEERELFAAIQEITNERDLEKAGIHGSHPGNEVDVTWSDPFWVINKK